MAATNFVMKFVLAIVVLVISSLLEVWFSGGFLKKCRPVIPE